MMIAIKLILTCAFIGYYLDGFDGAILGVGGLFMLDLILAAIHDAILLPLGIVKHRSGTFASRRF